MNRDVVEAQVRAVLPLEGSFAVFLGNAEKTFVIYVDESVGTAISMFMRGVPKERPLTHDLLGHMLKAFGGKVERVVINDVHGSIFHARLILSAENELHARKVIELDARPSDSIAMATQTGAPIFVAQKVWDEVQDMSEALVEIEKRTAAEAAAAALEESGDDDMDDEGEDDDDEDDLFGDDDDDDEDDIVDEEGDEELFADLDALEDEDEDEDDDEEDDEDIFGGFGGKDDDDEGEEWKKG
ncbi:MAG: bifunctional nuclease family protein [Verrucomicrobiaceae bacterium]|nr:bifunctional nuclease family protein [Verrucomicrobiaceae bacterium]